MKYIQKNPEPQNLLTWKAQKAKEFGETISDRETAKRLWKQFRRTTRLKKEIHDSLLQEQGFICCYCQKRIHRETSVTKTDEPIAISHLEHFQPRSTAPDRILDYTNLLASCSGREKDIEAEKDTEEEKFPIHCGHKKDEWYNEKLTISPLDKNCESHFRYTEAGQILAKEDSDRKSAAEITIDRLGLNTDYLQTRRKIAIDDLLDNVLMPDNLNPKQIQDLIQGYSQTNAKGEYSEFCTMLLSILNQYRAI